MKQIINIQNLNIYLCTCGNPADKKCNYRAKETPTEEKKDENSYCDKNNISDGVYFYTKKGACWKREDFDKCTEEIKGVAIIKGEQRIVVHPKGSDKDILLLDRSNSLQGKKYEDYNEALKDSDGYNATERLCALGSPAAKYCKSFGKEWYIPTLAEMVLMYDHKKELDECLSKIGEKLDLGWRWTSTRYGNSLHWVLDWLIGNRYDFIQFFSNRVRPVSAFL